MPGGTEDADRTGGRRPALPGAIPIFPLTGALLLPGTRLPLNIFEQRYLNMTRDALAGDRIIGMIQPQQRERIAPEDRPELYDTGCAGRITIFEETEDGRYLITLSGFCRFEVEEELPLRNGYRRVSARYERYRHDLELDETAEEDVLIDRDRLLSVVSRYFKARGIAADWASINDTGSARLVDALAMVCPFHASEKQALLEARGRAERARILVALMEMTATGDEDGGATPH